MRGHCYLRNIEDMWKGPQKAHKTMAADLALAKELYKLSGWGAWWDFEDMIASDIPKYDADFLLSKLPAHTLEKEGNGSWIAEWRDYADGGSLYGKSRTNASNALARLAIELFKHDVLLRG